MQTAKRTSIPFQNAKFWIGLVFALIVVLPGDPATAQENNPIRHVRSAVPAGTRKFTSGDWGLMQSEVVNKSDEPVDLLSLIYFGDRVGLQYGRRIRVPASSRRTFWIPVKIPDDMFVRQNKNRGGLFNTEARTILIDTTDGKQELLRDKRTELVDGRPFSIDPSEVITLRITDKSDFYDDGDLAGQTVNCLQAMLGHSVGCPEITDPRIPIIPATLDPASQVVLVGDRMATDATGRTALREWVSNGGRLWVMLDTIQEDTVRRLFGDAGSIQYVDRVSLTEFKTVNELRLDEDIPVKEFEKPVPFVRTIVDDVKVLLSVNGWPAMFQKDFGRGTIVFTTIGSRAFSFEKPNKDRNARYKESLRLPTTEMEKLAAALFKEMDPAPFGEAEMQPFVAENIGYEVVGRGIIVTVLGLFCLGLLVAGLLLSRMQKLGHLLWVAPLAAVAATIPLVMIGFTSRQTVPSTVAVSQMIDVSPAGDDLSVKGLAGVYQTESNNQNITADSTSVFVPDRTGVEGTAWRMVWTDLDKWQWENVTLPNGLRFVPFSVTKHAEDPVRAIGTFGPDGFEGTMEFGPLKNVRDAIVASDMHVSLGLDLDEGGTISGPVSNSLSPGQYSTGGMLSGEQVKQQDVFRQMMDFGIMEGVEATDDERLRKRSSKYPGKPTLLAWADPIDPSFDFNKDAKKTGSALVSVPIQFVRPEAGQTIRIPSVFMRYDSVFGPNDEGKSAVHSSRTGTWQKRTDGSPTTLRFQLPRNVLPFKCTTARLTVKVNAALRDMDIRAGVTTNMVEIAKEESPVGTFNYNITDATALALDEDGGIHVRLNIGRLNMETKDEDGQEILQDKDWRIDYLEMQVDGEHISND